MSSWGPGAGRRDSVLAGASILLAAHGIAEERAEPSFTMALTGDSIITRRLSVYQEPEFLGMIDLIRGADAAFTNLEVLFHDYEPYPMNESGGTYMRAEPALARELVWAGFDMVSRANNDDQEQRYTAAPPSFHSPVLDSGPRA